MSVEIVSVGANDPAVIEALRAELARSPLVKVVEPDTRSAAVARAYLIAPRSAAAPGDPVPQVGAVTAPIWAVVGTDGRLMWPVKQVGEEALIRENLEKVVKYTQALELRNPNPDSVLKDRFTLELMRMEGGKWVVARADSAGGTPVYEDGDRFGFAITSTHSEAAYFSVLDFAPRHQLDPFYPPRGATDTLRAGSAAAPSRLEKGTEMPGIEPNGKKRTVNVWNLQGDFADGNDEHFETLKVFITSAPADFSLLKQSRTRGAAPSGLAMLFQTAVASRPEDESEPAGTRAIISAPVVADDPDDWTTLMASFRIRKPR